MKGKERILMTEWPEMLNFVFEKSELTELFSKKRDRQIPYQNE